MSENEVHQKFIEWLDEREIPFIHSRTDKRTTTKRGEPDFYVFWMGRVIGVEIKVDKNKLSTHQEKRIAYLRKSGNRVEVCHSVEECIEATEAMLVESTLTQMRAKVDAVGENCCKIGITTNQSSTWTDGKSHSDYGVPRVSEGEE